MTYMAKKDTPLQKILFQGGCAEFINLEGFHFHLLESYFVWDMVKYNPTYVEFSVQLNVIGIDSVPCGPESNVDFFSFFWDNVGQFSCTRYSITLLPPPDYILKNPSSFTWRSETLPRSSQG